MAQVNMTSSFDKAFSREALHRTWASLKAAKRDAISNRIKVPKGWDGVTVARFERQLSQHLAAIERRVREGRYQFRPFVYHYQPKADGGQRKIAYSGIRDRIVQAALHEVLAPVIDRTLTESAYAYRNGRGPHDAIRDIYRAITLGRPFFVKSDFVEFFDRIEHERLHALIDTLDVDPRARQLAWRFLRTGDIPREGNGGRRPFPSRRTLGVPQGGVLSGALANLYLADFDRTIRAIRNCTLVRYADDFIVLCPNVETCREVFRVATAAARNVHLALHAGKKTTDCGFIDDGVNFVGFRIRGTRVTVKPSNVAKFNRRIGAVIAKHEDLFAKGAYASAEECWRKALRHVNRKIIGVEVAGIHRSWIAYFRIVNHVDQLRRLDRWVWTRLSSMARRLGLPSQSRSKIMAAGYRGVVREYWHVRKKMKAFTLPYRGLIRHTSTDSAVGTG